MNIIRIVSALQHLMARISRAVSKGESKKERLMIVEGSQEIVTFQKPKEKNISREGKHLSASQTMLRKSERQEKNFCHHEILHLSLWRFLVIIISKIWVEWWGRKISWEKFKRKMSGVELETIGMDNSLKDLCYKLEKINGKRWCIGI